jgi:putative hydrolase of the HAD superfamily
MTVEAVIFDVDGVLIVHPDPRGWSAHLERDLGIAPPLLQEAFFKPHWPDIIHGRAALHDRLAPVLKAIAPDVPCQHLIDYWFAQDAHLNQPLLDAAAGLRESGIALHLATVQDHERARYLWETLCFRDRFDHLHYSADLGAAKPHADFYARVEDRTGLAPADIFFIDDKQDNVDAARARGWRAARWTGETTLSALLAEIA